MSLLRFLPVALALCLSARALLADPPAGPALTALAAGPLAQSTHVLLGSTVRRGYLGDVMVVRVKVERWLLGHAESPEVEVLVGGPVPSTSAAFLDGRMGASYLLFLSRRPGGVAFTLQNRIAIEGLEAEEKIAAVEAQIGLLAIADPEERARAVLAHFVQALTAAGPWTRSNAARELNHLAGVRPGVFSAAARARIERVAAAPGAGPTVKAWLERLLGTLGPETAGTPAAAPVEKEPVVAPAAAVATAPRTPAERIARLDDALTRSGEDAPRRALLLFREAPEPEVRAWLVDWLAEAGHASAVPALRAAYGREDEPLVREAVVRAVGLLGTDADVPWLVERLGSARLVEAALLALARVRTPAALAALEAHRARCLAGTEEERDLAARIGHLLDPAFEVGERVGHRPPPDPSPSSPSTPR